MKNKNKKNKGSVAPVLAVILCVIIAFTGVIIYSQVSRNKKAQAVSDSPSSETESTTEWQENVNDVDAEKYYSENSQKVLSVTPAGKSDKVFSEARVSEELSSRGFGKNSPITYDYNIDGSTKKNTKINSKSDLTHPQYSVVYMTKNGDYWNINVCNGSISAYPVTYNLEHGNGTELIITESKSITSYDSATNCFYETIPKQNVLVVKQIPEITAQALEQLTAQEIDKL